MTLDHAAHIIDAERERLVLRSAYRSEGYVLLRNAIPLSAFDAFESWLVETFAKRLYKAAGLRIAGLDHPSIARHLRDFPAFNKALYERIKESPQLAEFQRRLGIAERAGELRGRAVEVSHIRFRLDLPLDVREYALWHQDSYYTKLAPDAVTAWVPLQDTPYELGCLKLMPRTHKLGLLPHRTAENSKRAFVSSDVIKAHPAIYLPMCKGDLLLFHGCLLHSGSLNVTDRVRFSLQARYSPP